MTIWGDFIYRQSFKFTHPQTSAKWMEPTTWKSQGKQNSSSTSNIHFLPLFPCKFSLVSKFVFSLKKKQIKKSPHSTNDMFFHERSELNCHHREIVERKHYEILGKRLWVLFSWNQLSKHWKSWHHKNHQKQTLQWFTKKGRQLTDDNWKSLIHLIEIQTTQKASPSQNKCYQCFLSLSCFRDLFQICI